MVGPAGREGRGSTRGRARSSAARAARFPGTAHGGRAPLAAAPVVGPSPSRPPARPRAGLAPRGREGSPPRARDRAGSRCRRIHCAAREDRHAASRVCPELGWSPNSPEKLGRNVNTRASLGPQDAPPRPRDPPRGWSGRGPWGQSRGRAWPVSVWRRSVAGADSHLLLSPLLASVFLYPLRAFGCRSV